MSDVHIKSNDDIPTPCSIEVFIVSSKVTELVDMLVYCATRRGDIHTPSLRISKAVYYLRLKASTYIRNARCAFRRISSAAVRIF